MAASGLRLDLHNHTAYSADGLMSPPALLGAAKARGLACIAVTDHNTIRGAQQCVMLVETDAGLPRVIPGIEISTRDGEIIGFYVSQEMPTGLPLEEAVARIKAQGGLVCLPHPYDILRRGTISRRALMRAAESADIVEVLNGRSLGPRCSVKAKSLAERLEKPGAAGSDAHRVAEVGSAYVVVDALPTRDSLVSLLKAGLIEHSLDPWEYTLNWVFQGLSPVTRLRRKVVGTRL